MPIGSYFRNRGAIKKVSILYTKGPLPVVNMVLFLRNKRFTEAYSAPPLKRKKCKPHLGQIPEYSPDDLMLRYFCLITNWGSGDYQLRSAFRWRWLLIEQIGFLIFNTIVIFYFSFSLIDRGGGGQFYPPPPVVFLHDLKNIG